MTPWLLEWQNSGYPHGSWKGRTQGVPRARGGGRGPLEGHPCCSPPIPCPADPAPVLEAARSLEDRLQQLQRLEPEPPPLKDLSRPWKKHPELGSTKERREGRSPAAEPPLPGPDGKAKAPGTETPLHRHEADKQKYVRAASGVVLGRCEDAWLCPCSCTGVSVPPSSFSFSLLSGWERSHHAQKPDTRLSQCLSVCLSIPSPRWFWGSSRHRHSRDRSLLLSPSSESLAHGFAGTG